MVYGVFVWVCNIPACHTVVVYCKISVNRIVSKHCVIYLVGWWDLSVNTVTQLCSFSSSFLVLYWTGAEEAGARVWATDLCVCVKDMSCQWFLIWCYCVMMMCRITTAELESRMTFLRQSGFRSSISSNRTKKNKNKKIGQMRDGWTPEWLFNQTGLSSAPCSCGPRRHEAPMSRGKKRNVK